MVVKEKVNVINGAESFYIGGNHIGVLLCHGFNGTPQSMTDIGHLLAKKGFTIFAPRLSGHGTAPSDLERFHYRDWINNIFTAYNQLKEKCSEIFIVGQSMGGALTLQLAAQEREIKGIYLLNPAINDVSYHIYKNKTSPAFIDEGKPDIKDKTVFEIAYDKVPIKAVNELLSLMKDTESKVHEVSCPITIFKSTVDHVVPPSNSEFIYEHVQSKIKRVIPLHNSYHVASMDFEKDFIAEEIGTSIHHLLENKQ
ncbi:alpha/beta hydrolase [Metabacillus fastidiosus]|uniref:alpha/beta hydrolase n=1 Tax=Metabacillus fastidiosus TaxID=1458 RepID=UPI003D2E2780